MSGFIPIQRKTETDDRKPVNRQTSEQHGSVLFTAAGVKKTLNPFFPIIPERADPRVCFMEQNFSWKGSEKCSKNRQNHNPHTTQMFLCVIITERVFLRVCLEVGLG